MGARARDRSAGDAPGRDPRESLTGILDLRHDTEVRNRLRLFPDYGAESPVWSDRGMVSFSQLAISEALRADLIAWQAEGLDSSHPLALRSEEAWETEGRLLASRT